MIRLLRRLFRRNVRRERWESVRHLDANCAARRAVIAQNRREVNEALRRYVAK